MKNKNLIFLGNFKKFVSFLVVAVLVMTTFSGCLKKEREEPLKRYDGVTLTYYKMFDDEGFFEDVIGEFLITHPGLTINYRKFTDFEDYQETILNELAEGEGPDIFSMQNTWFAANYRKLAPMPESQGNPEVFEQIFVDVAYDDLVLVDENGKKQVFGVPMTVDTLALYYNKDHFDDRLPSQGRPSSTWEGISRDVIALNKPSNDFDRFAVSGIAMGTGENIGRSADILYLLFLQWGVDFYNENYSAAVFSGANDLGGGFKALEALDFYLSFADPSQRNYSWNGQVVGVDGEKEVEAFAKGELSMFVGYAYHYDDILNEINILKTNGQTAIDSGSIRIAEIPQLEDPAVSTDKRVTYANYFAETVSRNSENQELAWEFLTFLTKKEVLAGYFDEFHKPTSRRDMINEQKEDPTYGVFASQIGYAESFPILDYYFYKNLFVNLIEDGLVEDVNTGDIIRVEEAITDLLPAGGLLNEEVKEEEEL